ncbi:MAG: hypothetical protein NZ902_01085 [Acidilobaceae archaeon]|nr:hypothetical protein [Acidilobaceae archaeon]
MVKTTNRGAVTTSASDRKARRENIAAALKRDSPVVSLTEPKVLNRRNAGRIPKRKGSAMRSVPRSARERRGERKKDTIAYMAREGAISRPRRGDVKATAKSLTKPPLP